MSDNCPKCGFELKISIQKKLELKVNLTKKEKLLCN